MNVIDSQGFIAKIKQLPDLEAEYAIESLGGTDLLYEKLLMRIIKFIPTNIEQMDGFIQSEHLLQDFAILTHGLKSILRQVGHLALSHHSGALEKAAKEGDKKFCDDHYPAFRAKLQHFCDQITSAASEATKTAEGLEIAINEDIGNYKDILTQAKSELDYYDALSSADLLQPLTVKHFNEEVDSLLYETMDALDRYQYSTALDLISKLLYLAEGDET